MSAIAILLVDDQPLFLDGLSMLLSAEPDIEIVGTALTGEQALEMVGTRQPHVVVMDVRMPVLDGVAATRRMQVIAPQCHVLLLTTFDDDEYVLDGLQAGAKGYLLKSAIKTQLVDAIRTVARGEPVLHPVVIAKVIDFVRQSTITLPSHDSQSVLSPRELEVLRLVKLGWSNNEVADRLGITEATVKRHLNTVYAKLHVANRTEAVEQARQLHII